MYTCTANTSIPGPSSWTYKRCGEPAVRILDEVTGSFLFLCEKHLEEYRRHSRIVEEKILVRKGDSGREWRP